MRRTACFALITFAGLSYAPAAWACSPPEKNLHTRFTESEQVFLATVEGTTKAAQVDSYDLKIQELFKAKPETLHVGAIVSARFNTRGQCGVGELKKGTRILVMMNDGEILSSMRAMPIWLETEQAEAFLNPMFDELILLRRMLFPVHVAGATPDEDTAIHIATKALIALVGPEEAKKRSRSLSAFGRSPESHAGSCRLLRRRVGR
jgi:hypothetical protein